MLRRASRSWPSRVARSMWDQPRSSPSSAMPSAGGLKAAAMKVSMQWAIASMPVAAVKPGGRPSVSSGSQIAERGKLADIETTVTHGIRSSDPDARVSQMPRFGLG